MPFNDPDHWEIQRQIESEETPANRKAFQDICAFIVKCQVCEQAFYVDDEPLCPRCAVYVPKAFEVLMKEKQGD